MKTLTLIAVSTLAIVLLSGCSMRHGSQRHPRRAVTMHVHQYDNHSHRARSRRHVPHKFFVHKAKKAHGRRGAQGQAQGQAHGQRGSRTHKGRAD